MSHPDPAAAPDTRPIEPGEVWRNPVTLERAVIVETYFELAQRGELDEHGKPSILRFAALGPRFASEMRLAQPPWPVQRALFALLGPLARRRGYST